MKNINSLLIILLLGSGTLFGQPEKSFDEAIEVSNSLDEGRIAAGDKAAFALEVEQDDQSFCQKVDGVIAQLENNTKFLSQKKGAATNAQKEIQSQIKKLIAERTAANAGLGELKKLKEKLKALNAQIRALKGKTKNAGACQKLAAAAKELGFAEIPTPEELDAKIEKLRKSISQYLMYKRDIAKLRDKLTALRGELPAVNLALRNANKAMDDAQAREDKILTMMQNIRLDALPQANREQRQKLENELKGLENELKQVRLKIAELKAPLTQAQENERALRKQIRDIKNAIKIKQQMLDINKNKKPSPVAVESQIAKLKKLKNRIAKGPSQQDCEAIRGDLEKIETLQGQVADLTGQIQAEQEKAAKIKDEIASINSEIQKLKALKNNEELARAIRRINDKIKDINDTIRNLKRLKKKRCDRYPNLTEVDRGDDVVTDLVKKNIFPVSQPRWWNSNQLDYAQWVAAFWRGFSKSAQKNLKDVMNPFEALKQLYNASKIIYKMITEDQTVHDDLKKAFAEFLGNDLQKFHNAEGFARKMEVLAEKLGETLGNGGSGKVKKFLKALNEHN